MKPEDILFYALWIAAVLFGLAFLSPKAHAANIDMNTIARIESSGNPRAINHRTQAYGMYQITQPCLDDYNRSNRTNYALVDMLDATLCRQVAGYYIERLIPRYLSNYNVPVTLETVLSAYNWGVGNTVKWYNNQKVMPLETVNYIRKYKERAEK